MNTTQQAENNSKPENVPFRTRWLNPRRKRFWVILVTLLYTLLGFFAVPALMKSSLVRLVQEDLGRSLTVENVAFNPYILSLTVQQLEMRDTDGVRLAAFDEFFVNFQLSSLFRWAWTFREIRLDKPYLFYERLDPETSRLSQLLADAAKNRSVEEKTNNGQAGMVRLLVHDLRINEGAAEIRDNVPATPADMLFGPINIAIQDLNTLPDEYGQQTVTVQLPDDASLQWHGNLALAPLDLKGEVQLLNANLAIATAYLKNQLPLDNLAARLSSRFQYHVRTDEEGNLQLNIDELGLELDDVAISGLEPGREFFALGQLALEGGKLSYPEQRLEFDRLAITEPELAIWRNAEGLLNLSQLVPSAPKQPASEAAEERHASDQPWVFALHKLELTQGRLNFADRSIKPAADVGISDLQLEASNLSNQAGVPIPLTLDAQFAEGGGVGLAAEVHIFPAFAFSGAVRTRDIPLALAQPYVQQFARIQVEQGRLDSDLDLSIPAGKALSVHGSLNIPALEITDTLERQRLLGWHNLQVESLALDLNSGTLSLSPLLFDRLFGRIAIYQDKTSNLSGLVIKREGQAAGKEDKSGDATGFNVEIGGIRVERSGLDFSDLSLPLPFATYIKNLQGAVSTIATGSAEPARIKLEGQVDEYGLSRIEGAINLLDPLHHTDIRLEFRNLLMSSLSPYTVEFAGRKIDEGRLNLDLRYDIDKSRLQAENKVVISDLMLGEKVAHPGAADLPLSLAVALLKDANGVIDISLPVKGNIDDPEFSIGGIIWQTFTGLITKAVSAPFKLLGSLIGLETEDLGEFQFLAGRSDLTPPELEKVVQLKQALLQRPKLMVEIKGGADPAVDVPALKYLALQDMLVERLGGPEAVQGEHLNMLDDEQRSLLEKLFRERFPGVSLNTVKAENRKPPVDDPEGKPVLDKLAYSASLRDRLLAGMAVGDPELTALAVARSEAIQAAFLQAGFDAGRVAIVKPEKVKSKDGQWVTLQLGLTSK